MYAEKREREGDRERINGTRSETFSLCFLWSCFFLFLRNGLLLCLMNEQILTMEEWTHSHYSHNAHRWPSLSVYLFYFFLCLLFPFRWYFWCAFPNRQTKENRSTTTKMPILIVKIAFVCAILHWTLDTYMRLHNCNAHFIHQNGLCKFNNSSFVTGHAFNLSCALFDFKEIFGIYILKMKLFFLFLRSSVNIFAYHSQHIWTKCWTT